MKPYLLFLILLSVFLLFFRLGTRPLLSSGENRASEIAVEMALKGNILIPYLNERIVLTKPPLFHWLIILANKVFGINEFASRFFGVVSGVATCVFAYLFGLRLFGRDEGLRAGIVLLVSPMFFWNVRCARIDALSLALFTMALFFFFAGYKERRRVFIYLWFLANGLGFLAKGHVSLIGFIAPVVYLLWIKRFGFLKEIPWLKGVLLFSIIAFPWYIYICFNVPDINASWFFIRQNVEWFKGMKWYKSFSYIPNFFLGMFPWSVLLVPVIIYTWKEFKNRNEDVIFLYIWMAVILCVFGVLGKKVVRYILPIFPPAAIIIGGFWDRISNRKGWINTIFSLYSVLFLTIIILLFTYPLYSFHIEPYLRQIVEKHIISFRYPIAISLLCAGVVFYVLYRKKMTGFVSLAAIQIFLIIGFTLIDGAVERDYYSPKPFISAVKKAVPEEVTLYAYNSWENCLRYYYGRHIEYLDSEIDLNKMLSSSGKHYIVMWEDVYNKLSDDMKEKLEVVLKGYRVFQHRALLLTDRY